MKIKSERDFWSGLMFLLVGIGFAWGASNYSFGTSARPGPGYFPFGLGETEDGEKVGHLAWRPLIIILFSVGLFGIIIPRLGLLISLPVLVLISSWASDEFSWKATIINAVVLTLMSWLIFVKGLSLTIPVLPTFVGG